MATQSTAGQPFGRPVIKPTQVIRRREPPALEDFSELFRRELETAAPEPDRSRTADVDTQEFSPVTRKMPPVTEPRWPPETEPVTPAGRWADRLRLPTVRSVVVLSAAVAGGFGAALLVLPPLVSDHVGSPARATAPAPSAASSSQTGATDPDGAGVLRRGSSGPAVTDLQERLRRVPNVYQGGRVTGEYDATLTGAVARFQLWYGVRGDETGVYGAETRRALESRT